MTLSYPAGWTYSIEGAEATTEARLGEGTHGVIAVSSYFQGDARTTRGETRIDAGTYGTSYNYVELGGRAWAPCHAPRALNVKTEVHARGDRRAFGRLGLLGDVFLTLKWRRC